MGGRIDSAGEAGDHRVAGLPQVLREHPGHLLSRGGGVSRPHDAHRPQIVEVLPADDRKQRRRPGDVPEQARIAGLGRGYHPAAELFERGKFVFGFGRRRYARIGSQPPAERGQGLQGRLRRALAIDELPEGLGPHILRADEAQPGKALRSGKDPGRRRCQGVSRPSASRSRSSAPFRPRAAGYCPSA